METGLGGDNKFMSKVLLIDPDDAARAALGRTLTDNGYQALTAEDGKSGLEMFARQRPGIVLTELMMPGGDGIEVLKGVKAMEHDVEVIVIAWQCDVYSAIAAFKNGASDFIVRPVGDEALLQALLDAGKRMAARQESRRHTQGLEQKIKGFTLELEHAQQELIRNERLATIGETVAGLAHYIKNILHGLRGGMYVLNSGIAKNKGVTIEEGWAMVQRNIDKVSSLVLDLLSYSKDRTPERSVCSPNEIVSMVVELLKERADQHNVRLVASPDPNLKEAYLDKDGIHNVLLNLVSNAIDACVYQLYPVANVSTRNWEVTVRTALRTDAMGDETIIFEVIDNGSGMTDKVKEKLFTRFFSTKGALGTGLGLLVSQKIVHEHGGEITVESKAGQGSAFTVRLKRVMPPSVSP